MVFRNFLDYINEFNIFVEERARESERTLQKSRQTRLLIDIHVRCFFFAVFVRVSVVSLLSIGFLC